MLSQFFIKLDGQPVGPDFQKVLERITVENSLHLPDVATLELHDPRLLWVDDARLEPGKPITISAQYGGREGLIFDGEIVELEPTFEPDTQRLLIRAFDRLHRLDRGRHVRSFIETTDGDLVEKIAKEVGLKHKVGPTPQIYPYLLQANESNLQFLQRRAAALGYLLFVEGETLCCVPPESDKSPIQLDWGATMAEFRPRLTTIGQVNTVTVRGWDPANKQAIIGEARAPQGVPDVGSHKNGGDVAKAAFHIEAPYAVVGTPVRTQAAAERLAQATADRIGGRFIEADGLAGGLPDLVAGKAVLVGGVGQRFGGRYFVTSTSHVYEVETGYQVQFAISGLHPATLLSLLSPPTDQRLGGGLVVGIVTDNNDPERQGRVKLKFPWLSNDHASDWARVVAVGGGPQRGIQFLPEVNDEVLVGFELDDMQLPYVLGGLWNGRDKLPDDQAAQGGDIKRRIIRSRQGHTITLDDSGGQQHILISDQDGNKVLIEGQKIAISDVAGNMISLESSKLTIKAQGNLALEAQGNIDIKGNGQVNIKGAMINLN
jgi:phage protein D